MDHRDGALDALVEQIRVESQQLRGVEHALVHDRPAAQRRNVEVAAVRNCRTGDRLLDQAADDVELPLEGQVLDGPFGPIDEHLADQGLTGLRARAETGVVGRNLTPAQEMEALLRHDSLEEPEALDATDLVRRQEDHAHAVAAAAAELEPRLSRLFREELVGDLDGQAGAVAGVLLGSGRASMLEVDQYGQGIANDGVGPPACDIDHEAEAARVVLKGRVIQTLGPRNACLPQLGFHPQISMAAAGLDGTRRRQGYLLRAQEPSIWCGKPSVTERGPRVKVAKVAIGNDTATLRAAALLPDSPLPRGVGNADRIVWGKVHSGFRAKRAAPPGRSR